ncbi:hypothetical protein PFUGPA_05578 [Plasmodium falciparum Palo Alto/Uganda]|uniref:Uncharacterized protein n=1 Tax=Plasmodium falciparum (isolate Palo Alto / Uganda) TaxID=57270 RepID=W4ITA5_PLAFP|nr:hypothetical protein PFUGPA_05578 [Plasmodium falciparum Palo Alto/Uganda]
MQIIFRTKIKIIKLIKDVFLKNELYKNFIKKLRHPPPGNSATRFATFLMKLSASGVEPTFSQGKVTYLTTGLLRQLNNSTDIK